MREGLQINRPYPRLIPPVPEGASFCWGAAGLELLLAFDRPSVAEIERVQKSECEFALAAVPDAPSAVFFLYCFGRSRRWSDTPYTPHLRVDGCRPDLNVLSSRESRFLLHVRLVDALTARVKALRDVSLSPAFSRTLALSVAAAALAPWDGIADYDQQLADAHHRFPTTESLLEVVLHRTRGGA